jgi:hypothetical protein
MGYRSSWVAIRGGNLASALKTLGLRVESESNEQIYDPGHYAVNTPQGFLIIMGDGSDEMETGQPEHAAKLSEGGEAIFFTSDTTMCTTIAAFHNRIQTWSFDHQGSDGIQAPTVSGTLPELARAIVDDVVREQEEADDDVDIIYDGAPRIGLAITGFRHDQTLSSGEIFPVYVLEKASR